MAKPKPVNYRLIDRDSEEGAPVYEMLRELVEEHHEHLTANRLALMWSFGWNPDQDGRLVLGKCKPASDIDRELRANLDFIILLNWNFWSHADVTDQQRRALLDHELCHAVEAIDEDGEPKVDARGRKVYRIRKHDVEEFNAIASRYGLWKEDLERFAAALREDEAAPLFAKGAAPAPASRALDAAERAALRLAAGVDGKRLTSVEITHGGRTVKFDAEAGKRARRELTRRGRAER